MPARPPEPRPRERNAAQTQKRILDAAEKAFAQHGFAGARLKDVARSGGNLFDELMETVKSCSLGQISQALYEVGGQYRRSM